jgi:acetolactate synthase-1/2/3 large subunit
MVRQWQELFFGGRYAETRLRGSSPRFDKVAQAYGAKGLRVTEPKEVRPTLQEALSYQEGPVVVDCLVKEEENVFPMVPAGGSIGDFFSGEENA